MRLYRQADLLRAYRQLVERDLRWGNQDEFTEETHAAMRSRHMRRELIGRLVVMKAASLRWEWLMYTRGWRARAAALLGEGECMKPIELVERGYVPEDDRELPSEDQTTFWIRPIEYPVYVQVLNAMARGHGGLTDLSIQLGTQEKIALLAGIVRIDNFKDKTGKLLTWPGTEEERLKFLSIIPGKIRSEVAGEIRSDGRATEEQKGESDSRSGSLADGAASATAKPPNGATADAG